MDHTPSKRRKLSPTTAVAVDASNTAARPISKDGRPTTPSRASFMSPTKASLARFNPSLMPRPRSAGRDARRELAQNASESLSPQRLNALPLRPTTPTSAKSRLSASLVRQLSASPTRKIQSIGGNLSAPARRRSRTPGQVSRSSILAQPDIQAQTALNPVLNQLQVNDNGLQSLSSAQASLGRDSRQVSGDDIPDSLSRVAEMETEEPELPPTPEQLGLEARPEPPKGLLSSSPTRRVTRRKAAMKRSPLKPPTDWTQGKGMAQASANVQDLPTASNKDFELQHGEDMSRIEDPEVTKRQHILSQLSKQSTMLEPDVSFLERAIWSIHDSQLGNFGVEEGDKLLSVLTATNTGHESLKAETKASTISDKLSLFLPFSKVQFPSEEPLLEQAPPPSHHPLSLDDPLPHLQAFTLLTVSSNDTLIASDTDIPLLKKELSLVSPTSILAVKLSLITNTVTLTVTSLQLSNISPWANAELGTWIRKQAPSGDISSIGWACSRYWEVASTRAKYWAQCKARFPHLMAKIHQDQLEAADPKAKSRKGVKGRKKGSRESLQEREIEEGTTERPFPASVFRSDVVANIGNQSLLFTRSGVYLLILWRIDFDWIGEVESDISAITSFPTTWENADERGSLRKVGEAFDRLLRQRGILEAIRIMVHLIFPDN